MCWYEFVSSRKSGNKQKQSKEAVDMKILTGEANESLPLILTADEERKRTGSFRVNMKKGSGRCKRHSYCSDDNNDDDGEISKRIVKKGNTSINILANNTPSLPEIYRIACNYASDSLAEVPHTSVSPHRSYQSWGGTGTTVSGAKPSLEYEFKDGESTSNSLDVKSEDIVHENPSSYCCSSHRQCPGYVVTELNEILAYGFKDGVNTSDDFDGEKEVFVNRNQFPSLESAVLLSTPTSLSSSSSSNFHPSPENNVPCSVTELNENPSPEYGFKDGDNTYDNLDCENEDFVDGKSLSSSPSSSSSSSSSNSQPFKESDTPNKLTTVLNDSLETCELSSDGQCLKVAIVERIETTIDAHSGDVRMSTNLLAEIFLRLEKQQNSSESVLPHFLKKPNVSHIERDSLVIENLSGNLGLKSIKDSLVVPFHRDLSISVPREHQVNYLEARVHPHHIHGIPWKFLNYEWYRLMSFVKFPSDSQISTIQLASKGFVYLSNVSDHKHMLICFFCTSQLKVLDTLDSIDTEHKRLGMHCPMVRGARCNNVSMEHHCPNLNADEILSQLLASRQVDNAINEPAATPSTSQDNNKDNVRSSQPSDHSASYVIVTNTSDLAESDGTAQNSQQFTQSSSQMMDDSASSPEQDESVVVTGSQLPSSSQVRGSASAQDSSSSTAESSSTLQSSSTVTSSNTQQNSLAVDSSSAQLANPVGEDSSAVQEEPPKESKDENGGGEATSYEKLGIITARPKRVEYAVYATRFNSFNEWPRNHHIQPLDLAKAGYFYTGYSDCARCFYCGGGLRNWEQDDDVWVEHARWFPKCAFLLQEVGKDFIDTVIAISKERDQIKYSDVIERMRGSGAPTPLKFKEQVVERDPAVMSIVDNGYDKAQILQLAQEIRKGGELLSSDKLYEAAKERKLLKKDCSDNLGSDSVSVRKGGNESRDREMIESLRSENNELRQQTLCKICMDMEVAVVFLPCGHLVSCTECSCALTVCPLCRFGIKGIVRAYVG